jgi:hypothetical protein
MMGPGPAEKHGNLQQAYRWLRENTPPDAYVAEQPVAKDSLELSSIAQRRVVAAAPSVFTMRIPYHRRLVRRTRDVVSRLGECRLRPRDLRRLFQVPAPWPDEIYALVQIDPKRQRSGPRCQGSWTGAVKAELLNVHYGVFRIDVKKALSGAPP